MNVKHVHRFFTKTHTAFRDCRVRFSLSLDNLSRNSCTKEHCFLSTFALIVFAHPYCARKFMSQWRHVIHRARTRKICTFGQNDNFARIFRFKEVGDPNFILDTSPSLTNFCWLSKNGQKMNVGSVFFPLSLPPCARIPHTLKLCEFGNAIN